MDYSENSLFDGEWSWNNFDFQKFYLLAAILFSIIVHLKIINFRRRRKVTFQFFPEKTSVYHCSSSIRKSFLWNIKFYVKFLLFNKYLLAFFSHSSGFGADRCKVKVCSGICAHFKNGFTLAKRSYINSISVGKIENSVENTQIKLHS